MKFPLVIKHRGQKAAVYQRTNRNPYYRLAYYAGGKRIFEKFHRLADARAAAERKVRELANGTPGASITPRLAREAMLALEKLKNLAASLDMPSVPTLDEAVAEYVEAKKQVGPMSLSEVAAGYLRTAAQVRRVPIAVAVDEYLAERKRRTIAKDTNHRPALNERTYYQGECILGKFKAMLVMDVCDLTKDHLELFFASNQLQDFAAKTRNHYRAALSQWLRWGVRRDYLPFNHRLDETPCMERERIQGGENEIYRPEEFAKLLNHTDPTIHPLIVIGGLAGLRTKELLRLHWEDVWRCPGYIEVSRLKAKTRQRRLVPILPALAAWLAPYSTRKDGKIWQFTEKEFHTRYGESARIAGITRRDNALRHSFISYRLAAIHNEHQVACEAGNTPQIIHRDYRELVTPEEAHKWFNVFPDGTARNIISLAQASQKEYISL